jgi:heat shock protein HslJ
MNLTRWVAAATLAAGLGGGCRQITNPDELLDGPWRLVQLTRSSGTTATTRGDEFTIEFLSDGRVNVRADCNGCGGTYEVRTGTLHVFPLACTRVYCVATAPVDSEYVMFLQAAETFSVQRDTLTIRTDHGSLEFERR